MAEEQEYVDGSSSSKDKSLYEILSVDKAASQQEIKKAYYNLALRLHPDKNPDDEGKEKFERLQKIISVLGDEEKRAICDRTGCVDDGDLAGEVIQNLQKFFRAMYKKITEAEIEKFEANYRSSDSEKKDLLQLYKNRRATWTGDLKSTKAYEKWAKHMSKTKPPTSPWRQGRNRIRIQKICVLVWLIYKSVVYI